MEPWPTGKGRPRAGQKLRCGGDSDRPSSSLRKSGRKATVTSEVFRLPLGQKGMIPSRRLFPLEPVDKVAKAAGETAGDSGTVAFPAMMPAIHRADGRVVVGQRLQPRVLAGPRDRRLAPAPTGSPPRPGPQRVGVLKEIRRLVVRMAEDPTGVRVSAMNSSVRCFRGGAPVAFIAASDSAGSSTFTIGRRDGVRHGSAHSWDITASPKAGGKGREIRLGAILSVGDTSQRVQPLHA